MEEPPVLIETQKADDRRVSAPKAWPSGTLFTVDGGTCEAAYRRETCFTLERMYKKSIFLEMSVCSSETATKTRLAPLSPAARQC